jgi:hypothetical protein
MKPIEILTRLLVDWATAAADPATAKALVLSHRTFPDDFTRAMAMELVLAAGDWRKAAAAAYSKWPQEKVSKFIKWAEKITAGSEARPFIMGVSNE